MSPRKPLILLLLTSCAAPTAQEFRPTENVRAASPEGQPASSYEVHDQSGRIAEVAVWSRGVYRRAPGQPTYLDLGIEVRNTGTQPLDLDPTLLSVEAFAANGAMAPGQLAGMNPDGPATRTIAPAAARDFNVTFALPQGMAPEDVNSFRARWGLVSPDRRRYVQFTQFTPDTTRTGGFAYGYAYLPAYGWYDPFLYDPLVPRVVIVHHLPMRRVVIVPGRFR
jgi:hypothetical protein